MLNGSARYCLGGWFFGKNWRCDGCEEKGVEKYPSVYGFRHVLCPYINHLRIAYRAVLTSSVMVHRVKVVTVSHVRNRRRISKTGSRLLCAPKDSQCRDRYYRRNISLRVARYAET